MNKILELLMVLACRDMTSYEWDVAEYFIKLDFLKCLKRLLTNRTTKVIIYIDVYT